MVRVRFCAVAPLSSFADSFHANWLVVLSAILLTATISLRADAITIDMEYSNEGDPVPHDENPSWDPDGSILKAHFQAAKAIWQTLLPGPGDYQFDFQWDDDIGATRLGQTTDLGPLDVFIEINPNFNWFADSTPTTDEEFSVAGTQNLFSQLSAADQTTYFPGAAPPGGLEVGFVRDGNVGTPGAGGFDANEGYDLLTVITHEIGHVLGISGIEPGEYNISPIHVGGTDNVLVLEGSGGHLAGDATTPGFLMCGSCELPGERRLPSGTDVLVIANDQSITAVHLARVGRISSGVWSNFSAWIGGAVPDLAQDVYIRQGGAVTLDADAQARDLLVASGNNVAAQTFRLTADGALIFNGAALSVGAGGSIAADSISGDPAALTTTAGSLVRFNIFTPGTSLTTTANFNGSVAIGYKRVSPGAPTQFPVFDPSALSAWNVAEQLAIGDLNTTSTLAINNGAKFTSATGRIGTTLSGGQGNVIIQDMNSSWIIGGALDAPNGSLSVLEGGQLTTGAVSLGASDGQMLATVSNAGWQVNGNLSVRGPSTQISEVIVESNGVLAVDGVFTIGSQGKATYRNNRAARADSYEVQAGAAAVAGGPFPNPYHVEYSGPGSLTLEDTAFTMTAAINVGGGVGNGALGGLVTFKDNSRAQGTQFHTNGGRRGPSSLFLPLETAGFGGSVRFENNADADTATFVNDGVFEFHGGTGGLTVFADSSTADHAKIHNHGAGFNKGGGGATHFLNNATAERATITNHADATFVYSSMSGQTVFYDSSKAGNATIENESGPNTKNAPGLTQFRNNSSADHADIRNRGNPTLGGGAAGLTEFYDTATAADATITLYEGYNNSGRTDFYNQSTAGIAHISIEATNPSGGSSNGGGGNLLFHDDSTAAQSQITLKAQACCNGVQFVGHATAAHAQFIQEDGSGAITFADNSTAANANFSVGQDSGIAFYNQSTAANALITMANRARVQFTNGASAGQSQIDIAGASAAVPLHLGGLDFNLNSTAGNATIVANGGAASGAVGARVSFINRAHAGNATITANGGTGGGAGAIVHFNSGASGDTAQLIANAGGTFDFGDQITYGGTQVGSIEGAGSFVLNGSLLTTGNRNLNTTVSGPIANGYLAGGALTKVGTGQLTLAGANSYSGPTTVNAGTVTVAGSIVGSAVVNSGGTLNGTGLIGGTVTVNAGGVFAPGTSPGTITLHGLTMTPSGTLNFEIGDPARDHIMLINNGNVALAGILNISLVGGFTPSLGQSFSVFEGSVGSIAGAFNSIVAPNFNGLTFGVMQNAGSVQLQVIPAPGSGGTSDLNPAVPEPASWQLVVAAVLLVCGGVSKNSRYRLRLPHFRRALPCVAR